MTSVETLLELLNKKGLTLSLAESCTGGLIGAKITSVAGSSSVFMGSAVTYSNDAKEKLLGVRHSTLLAHGAVSEETAAEMAIGSRTAYDADISASVTGIAGPGGSTPDKPVGTVWMAVTDGKVTTTYENHFVGDRESIREQSAERLIRLIIKFVGDAE